MMNLGTVLYRVSDIQVGWDEKTSIHYLVGHVTKLTPTGYWIECPSLKKPKFKRLLSKAPWGLPTHSEAIADFKERKRRQAIHLEDTLEYVESQRKLAELCENCQSPA